MAKSAPTFPPRLRPVWQDIRSWLRWHTLITRGQALRLAEDQADAYYQVLTGRIDFLVQALEHVIEAEIHAEWDRLAAETSQRPPQRHLSVAQ